MRWVNVLLSISYDSSGSRMRYIPRVSVLSSSWSHSNPRFILQINNYNIILGMMSIIVNWFDNWILREFLFFSSWTVESTSLSTSGWTHGNSSLRRPTKLSHHIIVPINRTIPPWRCLHNPLSNDITILLRNNNITLILCFSSVFNMQH